MRSWETVQLAQPTRGHFDLGTGYHGDVWLDLDVLFLQPALLRQPVRWMAQRLREHAVDAVCGPMEGGAFLAYAVSDLLATVFLPGYRTPGETAGYHLRPVPGGIAGWRVGIVDDAVNAGTAVIACAEALRGQGAMPVAVASLLALGNASTVIPAQLGVPFHPAATLPGSTWPAAQCPLCAESIPFTATPGPLPPRPASPPTRCDHEPAHDHPVASSAGQVRLLIRLLRAAPSWVTGRRHDARGNGGPPEARARTSVRGSRSAASMTRHRGRFASPYPAPLPFPQVTPRDDGKLLAAWHWRESWYAGVS